MDIRLLIHNDKLPENDRIPDTLKETNEKCIRYENYDNAVKRRKKEVEELSESSDSDSVFLSTRSSVSDSPTPDSKSVVISNREELFKELSGNANETVELSKITIVDLQLPSEETCDHEIRKSVINQIHERYVEPLLDITGFKWVRKEVPSKGKGLKLFAIKYQCSQQQQYLPRSLASPSTSSTSYTGAALSSTEESRSRQLSNPLKQFRCESHYTIRYTWLTQTIEIDYRHTTHAPLKRLPEKLKPFILLKLDKKAQEVYQEILISPEFQDIKNLISFSKVQSFWSKERNKKKEESTKEAFKKFLSA